METQDLAGLKRRLSSLERQIRKWKAAGFSVGALSFVAFALAALATAAPWQEEPKSAVFDEITVKTIKAEKIEAPVLTMLDKTGAERVRLRVLEGGPALTLYSEGGKAQLALYGWQEPQIVLFDKEGNARAIMGALTLREVATGAVSRYPPSTLVLCDEEGRIGFRAPRRVLMTDADRVLATKFK